MTFESAAPAARKRPAVFLHVGEPKSGTTFVQQIMWANRDALLREGVLLPGEHFWDHFRANQDLRGGVQLADDPTGSWAGEWDALVAQALQAERAAVISHELLALATDEQAARGIESLADADLHIVLSLRDFASLLPAEWQERVKHRDRSAWEDWLERIMAGSLDGKPGAARFFWRVHDSLDVLRRWSQGIAPDHVHVVTMPPPGSPPEMLWERFASVIGVDPAGIDLEAARPNASLGLAEVEMLRRLNVVLKREHQIGDFFYAVNVKERLAHGYLAARPAKLKPMMTPEQEEWARRRCEVVIEGLRESGVHIVGELDDLLPHAPMTAADPRRAPTREVPTRAILDAAIGALATVLNNQFDPPPPAPQEQRLMRQQQSAPSGLGPGVARRLARRYGQVADAARALRAGARSDPKTGDGKRQ